MKKIKRMFIVLIAVMVITVFATIGSTKAFAKVGNNGYAIPDSSTILQKLESGNEKPIDLIDVENDDVIYQNMGKYFIENRKNTIDVDFPIWVNDGSGIYFFDDEKWLITEDIELLCSYDGLYLSEGYTYNSDLTQADPDEFILMLLPNGLFSNAQKAIFKNNLGDTEIPSNSVVLFTESFIRWFAPNGSSLEYGSIDSINDGIIIIGENSYNYNNFLDALGLVQDSIKIPNTGGPDPEITEEANSIIHSQKNPIDTNDSESDKSNENGDLADKEQADSDKHNSNSENSNDNDGDLNQDGETENGGNNPDANPEDSENSEQGDPDSGIEPGEPGEQGESGDSEGEGSGSGVAPAYKNPVVNLDIPEVWSYALHGKLEIDDPSRTIQRGVRVAVYRGLSPDETKGRGALIRRTYSRNQDIIMSPLPPDTDIYVQYSYKYISEIEENGEIVRKKKTYVSGFQKLHTPEVNDENVKTLDINWDSEFASTPSGLNLNNFSIVNSSDYNPEIDSFDNFKLDTLPYINRIKLKMEPTEGNKETKYMLIGSSALRKIINGASSSYLLQNPKLDSNTKYKYTAEVYDRYGNIIPTVLNGVYCTDFEGTAYTSKSYPKISIEEVENVTDALTIKIKITDPDKSLFNDNGVAKPLVLTVRENNGYLAEIKGNWKDSTPIDDYLSNDTHYMLLDNPIDGKEYEFTIDSLAFSQTYFLNVTGSVLLTPDSAPEGMELKPEIDVVLGNERVFTASLSSGHINFLTSYSDLTDTKVTVDFSMNSNSIINILPLVDEFRIYAYKKGENINEPIYTLDIDELDTFNHDYKYDDVSNALILQEGDAILPRISLVGPKELFETHTPWQSLFVEETLDEETGKLNYSTPATIKIQYPTHSFETSTVYNVQINSIVIKSGKEYEIPTTLSNGRFMTKKIHPKLNYDDLFVAGNILEFINLQVYDPDQTIQENGIIDAYLYYGNTLLDIKTIKAVVAEDGPKINLHFDNLIKDGEYTLKLVAKAYNDSEGYAGYKTNYNLWTFNIKGGSSLNGSLNLEGLDFTSTENDKKPFISLSGSEILKRIKDTEDGLITQEDKKWYAANSSKPNLYYSEIFDLPEDATFIMASTPVRDPQLEVYYFYAYFYDENGVKLKINNNLYSEIRYGNPPLFKIPEGAKKVRFQFEVLDVIKNYGLQFVHFTTPQNNLLSNNVKSGYRIDNNGKLVKDSGTDLVEMIPVKPGQLMVKSGTYYGYQAALYTRDKKYIGYIETKRDIAFYVPNDVYYISQTFAHRNNNDLENGLYMVSDATIEDGFTANISIDVYDDKGYLAFGNENPSVKLDLFKSSTINNNNFSDNPELSFDLKLLKQNDGSYILQPEDRTKIINNLTHDSLYKVVLSAKYKDTYVELDDIKFKTDGAYNIIRNCNDMEKIHRNPYGNYLVVEDFTQNLEQNINIYGSIDFQGHVVTRDLNVTTPLIYYVKRGAKVENLVYVLPEGKMAKGSHGLFNYVDGEVENLIFINEGQVNPEDNKNNVLAIQLESGANLHNFILKFTGDIYYQPVDGGALRYDGYFIETNYGKISDGYIYSTNGAGFISLIHNGASNQALLLSNNYSAGNISNIYSVFDSWFASPDNNGSAALIGRPYYSCSNVYHVGDYYRYDGGIKNTSNPLDFPRMVGNYSTSSLNVNNYYISLNKYSENNISAVMTKPAEVGVLYDAKWQKNVLGDAFDVENTIPMGFYPRLNLPDFMQKYQEYNLLPIIQDDKLEVLKDEFAEGIDENIKDDNANIVITLRNPRQVVIQDLLFEGLNVDSIIRQGINEEGLYEVLAHVSVDEEKPAYKSQYLLKEVMYSEGISKGSIKPNYLTTNIEFWKTINNLTDWSNINDHMSWNYRLANDLDFKNSSLTQSAIMINGSKVKMSANETFYGKLDGDNHKLININFENTTYPFVFTYLSSKTGYKSIIKNLIIENMTISENTNATLSRAGFVGNTGNTKLENVHVRNSHVSASGDVGLLVGTSNGLNIINCSVADSLLDDGKGINPGNYGGLVGYSNSGYLRNCYTRNVDISINNTPQVYSVGEIYGSMGFSTSLHNSYAHGSITGVANNVGGIVGVRSNSAYNIVENSFSDVDINVEGNNVGGITGSTIGDTFDSISFGDIVASGSFVNRNLGKPGAGLSISYAYSKQKVSGLQDGEAGDARVLFTPEEVNSKNVWIDKIKLGENYDYSSIEIGHFPILLDDEGNEIWGQEPILLPKIGNDFGIEVLDAKYNVNTKKYIFSLLFKHPGISSDEIQKLYSNNSSSGLHLAFNGIDVSEAAVNSGEVEINLQKGNDADTTVIIGNISENKFTKMFDNYDLNLIGNINGVQYDLTNKVDFGKINYWEIPDINTWNSLMASHGKEYENFKIVGIIDFGNNNTDYNELYLGRLEGIDRETAKIINLNYNGAQENITWISAVANPIKNITFASMKFDMSLAEKMRNLNGAILSASGIENCDISNVSIKANFNSGNQLGFISVLKGPAKNVELSNVTVSNISKSNNDYAGSLAAKMLSTSKNIKMSNVSVDVPYADYVGGLYGQTGDPAGNTTSIEVVAEKLNVKGYSHVGGLVGEHAQNVICDIDDANVTGTYMVGISSGFGHVQSNKKIRISNSYATEEGVGSNSCVGGVSGQSAYQYANQGDVVLDNVHVKGHVSAGLIAGRVSSFGISNAFILNSSVDSQKVDNQKYPSASGGVCGRNEGTGYPVENIVIRNSLIKADDYAGGICGKPDGDIVAFNSNNIYIAEDTIIEATKGYAGGICGLTNGIKIKNVAIGAEIKSKGVGVGGIIGEFNSGDSVFPNDLNIENAYVKNELIGKDFVGGIIGRINNPDYKLTPTNISNIIVSTNISNEGKHASLWVNSASSYGSAGDINVVIDENSIIQGQTAKSILDLDLALGNDSYVIPKDGKLISSSDFNQKSTYKDLSFDSDNWSIDHIGEEDNIYMPFVKTFTIKGRPDINDQILKYSNYKIVEGTRVDAGITLPNTVKTNNETFVYMSDVDQVNIETLIPNKQVVVNGTTYTTDENGILTIGYNFVDDLTVDNVVYKAKDLTRTVLTHYDKWFYIDENGSVVSGDEFGGNIHTVEGVNNIVNLANGMALSKDGIIYSLENPDVKYDVKQGHVESRPYYEFQHLVGNKFIPVKVYYNFSLYGDVKINHRLFLLDGELYVVSPNQNAVYDGVILTKQANSGEGVKYFALLGENHKLTNYLNPLKAKTLDPENILHISNSFNSNSPILLARYEDGAIGINYRTGVELFNTRPKIKAFMCFAQNALGSIFGLNGTNINDDSYALSEGNITGAFTENSDGNVPNTDDIGISDNQGAITENGPSKELDNESSLNNSNEQTEDGLNIEDGTSNGDGNAKDNNCSDGFSENEKLLMQAVGDKVILFNDSTGKYETFESEALIKGTSDSKFNEEELKDDEINSNEDLNNSEKEKQDSKFESNNNIKRLLRDEDKQGFILLGIVGLVATFILTFIYVHIIKKRKEK